MSVRTADADSRLAGRELALAERPRARSRVRSAGFLQKGTADDDGHDQRLAEPHAARGAGRAVTLTEHALKGSVLMTGTEHRMRVGLPWYRAMPYSSIVQLSLTVDGVPAEDLQLEAADGWADVPSLAAMTEPVLVPPGPPPAAVARHRRARRAGGRRPPRRTPPAEPRRAHGRLRAGAAGGPRRGAGAGRRMTAPQGSGPRLAATLFSFTNELLAADADAGRAPRAGAAQRPRRGRRDRRRAALPLLPPARSRRGPCHRPRRRGCRWHRVGARRRSRPDSSPWRAAGRRGPACAARVPDPGGADPRCRGRPHPVRRAALDGAAASRADGRARGRAAARGGAGAGDAALLQRWRSGWRT